MSSILKEDSVNALFFHPKMAGYQLESLGTQTNLANRNSLQALGIFAKQRI